MTRMHAIAALLVVFAASALTAAQSDLQRIAPDQLVKGWTLVKDTTLYGKGDGITSIYNGGYQLYTKAGVQEALRRMYEEKDRYVEVTVHRMSSAAAASKFLGNRYRAETGKTPPARGFRRFTVSESGSTMAYSASGKWFLTVMTYGTTAEDKKAVAAFVTALEKRK